MHWSSIRNFLRNLHPNLFIRAPFTTIYDTRDSTIRSIPQMRPSRMTKMIPVRREKMVVWTAPWVGTSRPLWLTRRPRDFLPGGVSWLDTDEKNSEAARKSISSELVSEHQPGRSCRTCTRLNIVSSINTFTDKASTISVIASFKFFFRGPGIINLHLPKLTLSFYLFSALQRFSFTEAFVFPALSQPSGLQDQGVVVYTLKQIFC